MVGLATIATMNALGTSTSELVSRVMYGTVNFVDGLSSSAAWTGLIPGGRLLSFLSPTIGDVMKTFRVEAFGELGGDKIYLNSIVLIGQSTEHNAALILHELLHNVTGKLDTTIQRELGLEKDSVDTHNITDRIMKDCFK